MNGLSVFQGDISYIGVGFDFADTDAITHTHNSNICHIPFQKGIGGLCSAVGNEYYILCFTVDFLQKRMQNIDNATSNALFCSMCGMDFLFPMIS